MFQVRVVSFVALALFWFVADVVAQDSGKTWRLTYQDRTSARNPVAIFRETRQGVEGIQQLLMSDNASSKGLGLTPNYSDFRIEQVALSERQSELVDNVRDAKEAVDKAKEIQKKGIAALVKERKLGDTLREYRKVLNGALADVQRLRSSLLSMTGNIERRTFDQINRQIEDFNKQAEDYNQKVSSPENVIRLQQENGGKIVGRQDYPTIATLVPVRPDQLKGTLANNAGGQSSVLADKKGQGKFGGSEMPVAFNQDGTVTFGGGSDSVRGHFMDFGNRVTMVSETFKYEGTISGNTLSGTRQKRGSEQKESWTISLGGTATKQPDPQNGVIGKWAGQRPVGRKDEMIVVFNADGTGTWRGNERAKTQVMTWSLRGEKLEIKLDGELIKPFLSFQNGYLIDSQDLSALSADSARNNRFAFKRQ